MYSGSNQSLISLLSAYSARAAGESRRQAYEQLRAMQKDQRFAYDVMLEHPKFGVPNPGSVFVQSGGRVSQVGPSATPWVDLDPETKANDLWSITLGGMPGSSEGDFWDPSDISEAKRIIGEATEVSPDHIRAFEQYLLRLRDPHFMNKHPGKKAYAPP